MHKTVRITSATFVYEYFLSENKNISRTSRVLLCNNKKQNQEEKKNIRSLHKIMKKKKNVYKIKKKSLAPYFQKQNPKTKVSILWGLKQTIQKQTKICKAKQGTSGDVSTSGDVIFKAPARC